MGTRGPAPGLDHLVQGWLTQLESRPDIPCPSTLGKPRPNPLQPPKRPQALLFPPNTEIDNRNSALRRVPQGLIEVP